MDVDPAPSRKRPRETEPPLPPTKRPRTVPAVPTDLFPELQRKIIADLPPEQFRDLVTNIRAWRERTSHRHALLHATRELMRHALGVGAEPDHLE